MVIIIDGRQVSGPGSVVCKGTIGNCERVEKREDRSIKYVKQMNINIFVVFHWLLKFRSK